MPPQLFWMHRQVNSLYQFWVHTQLIGKMPPLFEFLFNTPSHHRVHHGRNVKYLDKNYAGILIIWDRIFGTFEPEEEVPVYGLVYSPNNFNLLTNQFGYYGQIFRKSMSYSNCSDKLSAFIKGPGWIPGTGRLGDPSTIPTDLSQPPYDPKIPSGLVLYNLLNFTSSFLILVVLIPRLNPYGPLDWCLNLFLVFSFTCVTILFQNGPAAFIPWEISRVAIFCILEISTTVYHHHIGEKHLIWWADWKCEISGVESQIVLALKFCYAISVVYILYNLKDICNFYRNMRDEKSANGLKQS